MPRALPRWPGRPGPRPGAFLRSRAGIDTVPRVVAVTPNSDRIAGGASVTITGANFRAAGSGAAPSVLIGGVAATAVVVVDVNTITCTVPAAADAGLVDISVTCGTQTGTLAGAFTYFKGSITNLSPAFGVLAGGASVLITGRNFVTGSTITFGGVAATGVVFVDAEHFRCVTPNHAIGYVDVVITEPTLVTVTLRNGFQYTLLTRANDIRRQPGIVINDTLNNTPNTCNFRVDGRSNVPAVGEMVEIKDSFDGDRLLFRGTAQSVGQNYVEDELNWDVTAIDFTWLLNRRRPFGFYFNTSVSVIVKDLIARFAPGFTSAHVQTNLAKVTATFDGSRDLATCFSDLALAIGGGHWYVDYDQDVHFFHIVPAGLIPPSTELFLTGTPMTVVEGAGIPSTFGFTPGYYIFGHTFVYDDGTESSFQPLTDCVLLSGHNIIEFSNIPVGAPVGALTCVKRRIYYIRFVSPVAGMSPIEDVRRFAEVDDNVTVAFTTWFQETGADVATVTSLSDSVPLPKFRFTGHPAGPPIAPTAKMHVIGPTTGLWQGGAFQFKVACVYRDGSVSFPSPPTNTVAQPQTKGYGIGSFDLTNIPLGVDVNGVDVIARFIYYCMGEYVETANLGSVSYVPPVGFVCGYGAEPDWVDRVSNSGVLLLNDNVTTELLGFKIGVPYVFGRGNKPYGNKNLSTDPVPLWPNPDGPSLETDPPPDAITSANVDLLRDPPFRMSVDSSQVRNRIFVIGSGSSVSFPAASGDTKISVADINAFSPAGGTVKVAGQILGYTGVEGVEGDAAISLSQALGQAIAQGAAINNWFEANSIESQQLLGAAELDKDGNPTDGIHEYTIVDTSLKALFQLYMRAYAELELFALPIVTVTYATRDSKTRSGVVVSVDMTNPPCVGEFLIQEVTIDQIHDESDVLMPRYTVTAASVRFELNDLLLQIIGLPGTGGNVSGTGTSLGGSTYGGSVGGVGGGAAAGLIPAAVTEAVDAASGFLPTVTFSRQKLVLTRADILTLNTVPVKIVEGIADSIIVPFKWFIERPVFGAGYGANATFQLQYEGNGQALLTTITPQLLSPNNVTLTIAGGGVLINVTWPTSPWKGKSVMVAANVNNSGGHADDALTVWVVYHVIPSEI